MVLVTSNENIKKKRASTQRLLSITLLGLFLLLIPVIFVFFDPIMFFAEFKLRLDNGSMVHELLSKEFEGPKLFVYLFNVTNAGAYAAGTDSKMRLEEVGPFVYREYRVNADLEINKAPGIMRYTPRLRPHFLPDESVADPKDVYVTMPNVPLLLSVTMVSKNKGFLRHMFNVYAMSLRAKAFVTVTAHDYFWGYPDPLVQLGNTLVPGLIYFNTTGLLERLYDRHADYRLDVATSNEEKFSVKKVTRFVANKNTHDFVDMTEQFTDTYEGAVFPTDMSQDMPLHIYRHSLCKTFQLQYRGRRKMAYEGDSFVYGIHPETFNETICNSDGWCPSGLKDMGPCYLGLPLTLSKGHFLDADPRLQTMFEGIKPNREEHDIEIIIDPKIGVTLSGTISLQLSLFLSDIAFNAETRRLNNIVMPLAHIKITSPPMLPETKYALNIMYTLGPYLLRAGDIVCIALGISLLLYTVRLMYRNFTENKALYEEKSPTNIMSHNLPLLK